MNRVFKVVWNRITSQWVVTSELGKSGKKSARSEKRMIAQVATIALSGALLTGVAGGAEPKHKSGDHENFVVIKKQGDGSYNAEFGRYNAYMNAAPAPVIYAKDVVVSNNASEGFTFGITKFDSYSTASIILDGATAVNSDEFTLVDRSDLDGTNAHRDEVIKLLNVEASEATINARNKARKTGRPSRHYTGKEGPDSSSFVIGVGTTIKSADFGADEGGFDSLDIEFQDGIADRFSNANDNSAKITASKDGVTNMTLRLSGAEELEHTIENGTNILTSTYKDTETTLTADDVTVLKGSGDDSILGRVKASGENGKIIIGRNATINDGVLLTSEEAKNHKYNLVVEGVVDETWTPPSADVHKNKVYHKTITKGGAGTYRYISENSTTFDHNLTVEEEGTFIAKIKNDAEFDFGARTTVDFAGDSNFIVESGLIKISTVNNKVDQDGRPSQANFIVKAAGTVIHDAENGGRLDNLTLDGGAIQLTGKANAPDNWDATPLNIDGDKGLTIKGDGNKIIWDEMPNNGANYDQQKNILDQQEVTSAILVKSDKEITVEDGATMTLGKSKDAQNITVDMSKEYDSTKEYFNKGNFASTKIADYEQDGEMIGEVLGATAASVNKQNIGVASGISALSANEGKQITLKPSGTNSDVNIKLTGEGGFDLAGGDQPLILNNPSNDFKGESQISGGTVQLGDNNTLGNASNLTIKEGATLDLNDKEQTIKEGNLVADKGAKLHTGSGSDGKLIIDTGGSLTLNNEGITGKGTTTINKQGNLYAPGDTKIEGNLENNSHVYIGAAADRQNGNGPNPDSEAFGTLTVEGDYIANNGSNLHFAGNYAKDDSPTDKLVIGGDLKGTGSKVHVENIKGLGDQTDKGILLIDAENSSNKDAGFFTLEGDGVSAGEYIYDLNGADGQWHLQSVKKSDPNQPGGSGGGTIPNQPGGSGNNLLNPQTGSYLANQYAANTMFNHKIHDRRYFDTAKQLWGRIDGHFGKFKYAGGDSAKVDYDHYVIQLGGDLFRHAEHPFVVGVMGAYGHTKSKITEHGANGRSYTSKGRGNGYALGVYATYGSVEDFYLDGWIQYVHMSSKVKNEFVANPHREERYKNKGFVASLEAGKLFQATENLYIQPQGQITWMGVKQDSHTGRDGFRVDATKDNVQIRLGARFMGNYQPDGSLNPYAELNYFHNTKPFGVRYDGGRTYEMSGSRNLGQVKVGVNGHLNSDTAMWGEISHAQGRKSYRDTKLSIGIKHEF